MKRLAAPHVWLPLLLLVLTIAGMFLLFPERCTTVDSRIRQFYATRHYVMCAFNALSAAAGCGLFTYDVAGNFTPEGHSILALLGLAGAFAYLAALFQALGRLTLPPAQSGAPRVGRVPRPLLAAACFLAFFIVGDSLIRLIGPAKQAFSIHRAAAAYLSLGWNSPGEDAPVWLTPIFAFVGACGGMVWLLSLIASPHAARGWLTLRRFGLMVATYALWLALVAGAVWTLEVRRSYRTEGGPSDKLMDQDGGARFARSYALVASTSGGGIATEPIAERHVTDGTKALLALTVLVGGLPGSAGGGMTWLALLLAIGGAPLARRLLGLGAHAQRAAGIAARLVILEFAAALIVGFGLIVIEQLTASYFQESPTFADALLDACSLVGGAGLSSGLAATVTSENLSSGMRQSADLYLYGTAWMMLAMLLGRVLPVWVLCRAAASPPAGQE